VDLKGTVFAQYWLYAWLVLFPIISFLGALKEPWEAVGQRANFIVHIIYAATASGVISLLLVSSIYFLVVAVVVLWELSVILASIALALVASYAGRKLAERR
jgi:hypothetical protein